MLFGSNAEDGTVWQRRSSVIVALLMFGAACASVFRLTVNTHIIWAGLVGVILFVMTMGVLLWAFLVEPCRKAFFLSGAFSLLVVVVVTVIL